MEKAICNVSLTVFEAEYDDSFYGDLYGYAAICLLRKAEGHGYSETLLRELRPCLADGLPRGNYFLRRYHMTDEQLARFHLRLFESRPFCGCSDSLSLVPFSVDHQTETFVKGKLCIRSRVTQLELNVCIS